MLYQQNYYIISLFFNTSHKFVPGSIKMIRFIFQISTIFSWNDLLCRHFIPILKIFRLFRQILCNRFLKGCKARIKQYGPAGEGRGRSETCAIFSRGIGRIPLRLAAPFAQQNRATRKTVQLALHRSRMNPGRRWIASAEKKMTASAASLRTRIRQNRTPGEK